MLVVNNHLDFLHTIWLSNEFTDTHYGFKNGNEKNLQSLKFAC